MDFFEALEQVEAAPGGFRALALDVLLPAVEAEAPRHRRAVVGRSIGDVARAAAMAQPATVPAPVDAVA